MTSQISLHADPAHALDHDLQCSFPELLKFESTAEMEAFANVLVTIPVTVWLVVGQDKGASGLLWGQYGTGAVFLAGLVISQRHRLAVVPDFAVWRRMLRWGLLSANPNVSSPVQTPERSRKL